MKRGIKNIIYNVSYAFFAQGISLCLSLMLSFILPKVLGVAEFGYWQLYMFYSLYTMIFQLGLADGIYLRIGGKKYEEINLSILKSQYIILMMFQVIFGIIILSLGFIIDIGSNRKIVLICLAITIIVINSNLYFGYIFQSVHKPNWFSTSIFIEKLFSIILAIVLIVIKCKKFEYYIYVIVFSKVCAFIYCLYMARNIISARTVELKVALKECKINICVGSSLMISSLASMLIIGSSRQIIDMNFGIEEFGKFSFSLSATQFILQFTAQISLVLYPILCRMKKQKIKVFYENTRLAIGVLLSGFLLLYYPISIILVKWLPQYSDSIKYMVIMFPILVYDSKMHLYGTLYLKVFRLEKKLLKINIISCIISIILSLIGAYIFHNIKIVALFMVLVIMIRFYLAEYVLVDYLNTSKKSYIINNLLEAILTIVFVLVFWFVNNIIGFILYFLLFVMMVLINGKSYIKCIDMLKK